MNVIYVAGWGRSGTTIVGNILGAYDGVFTAGELHYLWRRGLRHRRRCGCGDPVPECRLWTNVLWSAFGSDRPDPARVATLQRRVVRVRHTLALARRPWSAEVREYADLMSRLYHGIREVTGASVIVDSSKLPSEAAVLSRLPGVTAHLLHMVRDPRAVAHSWARPTEFLDAAHQVLMTQHTPSRSTANWLVWNGLAETIGRGYGPRYRRLRYEDVVADPRGQLEALLDEVGVRPLRGPFTGSHRVHLPANHTVSGNPSRFRSGDVDIRPDDRWRVELATRPRLVATLVAAPLLARYRYPVRSR